MRILLTLIICFVLGAVIQKQKNEPEHGGIANIKRELVFDVPKIKLLQVFQKYREDFIESKYNKIVKQEGDKITIEITLPSGVVTNITLQQRQGVDASTGVAFFYSSIVQTDGFITRQDTSIKIRENGRKSLVEIEITVQAPEMRTAFVRAEIIKSINRIDRKLKGYLDLEK